MIGRPLAADPHVLARLARGRDGHGQQRLDRLVAFVEQVGDEARIPVKPKRELGHVVGADGEAVEVLQELVRQQGVGGQLAHHDDFQPPLAAAQAILGQDLDHLLGFPHGTHEGDHHLDVGQPHDVTHPLHRLALEGEAGAEAVGDVARRATEADHGVLFVGLVAAPSHQVGVFVGLEVRHPHYDPLRPEGGGQGGDPLGQLGHIVFPRALVAGDHLGDGGLELRALLVELQQRLGVYPYHAVDDELEARQPDACIGQLGKIERPVRVAHVHHDFDGQARHVAHLGHRHVKIELAVVDEAGVPFRAGDGDELARCYVVGGIATAHHGRDAELPGDDGGVTGAATPVGDDGRSPLHDGLPVRIRHVGDQHIAGLHLVHLADGADDPRRARANLVADGAPLDQHLDRLLEGKTLEGVCLLAATHGFRAGLDYVEPAILPVLGPLDIHGAAIVLLYDEGLLGQLHHFFIADAELVAFGIQGVDDFHLTPVPRVIRVGHLDKFRAERLAHHGGATRFQGRLVHVELVRVDGALHHHLAEAMAAGDEDHVVEAGLGIQGEHDARGSQVRAHHALDAGGEGHALVVIALVDPIGDGAIIEQGGEHVLDRRHDGIDAAHVEEGLLLTCKRRVRHVFGGGGGAHRERRLETRAQLVIGGANGLLQLRLEGGIDHPLADLVASGAKGRDVIHIQAVEQVMDLVVEPAAVQKLIKSKRRGGKATWHGYARSRELADHFTEGCVFAANSFYILHSELLVPEYVLLHLHVSRLVGMGAGAPSAPCCVLFVGLFRRRLPRKRFLLPVKKIPTQDLGIGRMTQSFYNANTKR